MSAVRKSIVRKCLLHPWIEPEWIHHTWLFSYGTFQSYKHQYLGFIEFSVSVSFWLQTILTWHKLSILYTMYFTTNPQYLCSNGIPTVYHILTPSPTEVFIMRFIWHRWTKVHSGSKQFIPLLHVSSEWYDATRPKYVNSIASQTYAECQEESKTCLWLLCITKASSANIPHEWNVVFRTQQCQTFKWIQWKKPSHGTPLSIQRCVISPKQQCLLTITKRIKAVM